MKEATLQTPGLETQEQMIDRLQTELREARDRIEELEGDLEAAQRKSRNVGQRLEEMESAEREIIDLTDELRDLVADFASAELVAPLFVASTEQLLAALQARLERGGAA